MKDVLRTLPNIESSDLKSLRERIIASTIRFYLPVESKKGYYTFCGTPVGRQGRAILTVAHGFSDLFESDAHPLGQWSWHPYEISNLYRRILPLNVRAVRYLNHLDLALVELEEPASNIPVPPIRRLETLNPHETLFSVTNFGFFPGLVTCVYSNRPENEATQDPRFNSLSPAQRCTRQLSVNGNVPSIGKRFFPGDSGTGIYDSQGNYVGYLCLVTDSELPSQLAWFVGFNQSLVDGLKSCEPKIKQIGPPPRISS